ncbi:hypothetical protein CR513_10997, partial [Mucuna pruriens]
MMDRSMIDATSGGALMDKTPPAARHLISNIASNTQQFGIREPNQSRMVNEIDATSNQRLENQLTELTSLVRQLAVSQHQPSIVAKVCGICTSVEHPTDMCPTLQETESDQTEHVGAIGGNHIRLGQLITSNMEDNHFGQVRNKAVRNSESRISVKRASRINRLPIAEPTISSATFPKAPAIESTYSR